MADHGTLVHNFINQVADLGGNLTGPSEWNEEHKFKGGVNGDLLIYDNTQTDNVLFKSVLNAVSGRLLSIASFSENLSVLNVSPSADIVNGTFTLVKSNSNVIIITVAFTADASGAFHANTVSTFVDSTQLITNSNILAGLAPNTFYHLLTNLSLGSHVIKGRFNTSNLNFNPNTGLQFLVLEFG